MPVSPISTCIGSRSSAGIWSPGSAASPGSRATQLRFADGAAALAAAEPEIVAHMNAGSRRRRALYAERLLGRGGAGWRMTGIDPEGLDLRREPSRRRDGAARFRRAGADPGSGAPRSGGSCRGERAGGPPSRAPVYRRFRRNRRRLPETMPGAYVVLNLGQRAGMRANAARREWRKAWIRRKNACLRVLPASASSSRACTIFARCIGT